MSKSNRRRYDLYLQTPATGLMKVAQTVLQESSEQLVQMAFRYTEEYRLHEHAFALDPVQLPLSAKEMNLYCSGGIPGVLDDYLPDDWGRKVLAKLAYYRHQHVINQHSAIDILSQLSDSRTGALQWVDDGEVPNYELGCDIKYLSAAEASAQSVDAAEPYAENLDEMSLLYLANAGSGIGGARPKVLVYEGNAPYLAKFNRRSNDAYNNAKVELACLQMAKEAGLNVLGGQLHTGVNNRDVLLLERFDVVMKNKKPVSRRHLVTLNALLKNRETQRDRSGVFLYDDIANLLKKFSMDIEADLTQLLSLMFFNRAINNLDDHERNFSLISEGDGFRMAPGYDMVPSLTSGAYPVAGYQYNPRPPTPSEAIHCGKIFGLPKTAVKRIADQVISAVEQWPVWAEKNEVSDKDSDNVQRVIRL
ncbi:MAG: type II toxin-antitoxin system HipA family toxin [Gammaproteobacteria bacterium]